MDRTRHQRFARPTTSSGRRWSAFASMAQLCTATAACALWIGLALPGLALVPGAGGNANASVSISLQSALLGIDEGNSRLTPASMRAALRALGLDPNSKSLSAALLRVQAEGQRSTLLAQLDDRLRALRKSSPTSHTLPQTTTGALPQSQTPPTQAPSTSDPLPGAAASTPDPASTPDVPKLPAPKLPTTPVAPVTPVTPTAPAPAHVPVPPGLAVQTIFFTSTPPQDAIVGGPAYVVSATAGSGLPVVFTAASTDAGVCTVSGSTVTPVGAGTCTINANQSGNSRYYPAPQAQQSFSVRNAISLSVQSIDFTSTAPSNAVVAGTAYTVSATASSGLPVMFSAAPENAGVCTLANGIVSFEGTGMCLIYADQAGDDSYLPRLRSSRRSPSASSRRRSRSRQVRLCMRPLVARPTSSRRRRAQGCLSSSPPRPPARACAPCRARA